MNINEVYEMAQFCFPWSLVEIKENIITVDNYSISKVTIDVATLAGPRQFPGYIVIRENAPDENVIVECLSAQKALTELAKALAVDSVSKAFDIYDPCMVVNPRSL
jgi:hypothetical protein